MFYNVSSYYSFINLTNRTMKVGGPQISNRGRCSLGKLKSAKLKDKEYTINAPIFFTTLQNKKEMDAPNFWNFLVDGQLLIYVADAVSPSIIYLWTGQGAWIM